MHNVGLEEGDDSDAEDVMEETKQKTVEYEALNPFKELYPSSEIVKSMRDFN